MILTVSFLFSLLPCTALAVSAVSFVSWGAHTSRFLPGNNSSGSINTQAVFPLCLCRPCLWGL